MNKRAFARLGLMAVLLAALGSMPGCYGLAYWLAHSIEDVTSDEAYWGGYAPGRVYRLRTDLFLHEHEYLLAPGRSNWQAPPLDEYRRDPKRWPQFVAVLPAGTRLEVFKFVRREEASHTAVDIYARILDGPMQGHETDISPVSKVVPIGDDELPPRYGPDARYFDLDDADNAPGPE